MKVSITTEDIKKGIPTNFFSCPVALAVSRATKKSIGVAWGSKDEIDPLFYPMFCKSGKWTFVYLPVEVLNWINDFDRKMPVEPIDFEVEL
jgi:hypothetical protein